MKLPHYHVTAGIIFNGNRILLGKRRKSSHLGGLWEFPGGKQEQGENLEECLKREIREELAIDVEVGDLYTSVDHAYETFSITLHLFICRLTRGEPIALGVADFQWVTLAELPNFEFPPADRQILDIMECRPPHPPG
jgi:mutator protein MutT